MQIDGSTLERPSPPLDELLQVGLEARPGEVALISAVRSLTWRELDEESAALAGGYRGLGLEPGDRLASLMPNRIDLVVHYLACFRAGLIATPLNYRYTFREIDHALEVSGATALLAHVERAEDVSREPARGLSWGSARIAYSDDGASGVGWRVVPQLRRVARARTHARRAAARPERARRDLLHLGQHRAGQGRHPHARVAALDDRQRRRCLRARRRPTSSCPAPRCRTSAPSSGR